MESWRKGTDPDTSILSLQEPSKYFTGPPMPRIMHF